MIKTFVADDHVIVRQGLKQIVADTHDIVVAGEASDGYEVLDKVLRNDYDVVLLDITMPGRSGLDILSELKSRKPKLPVLVLSIHPEEQYATRVLKAGAAGYLTKASASEELVAAIRKVSVGGKYVSPYLAEKLAFDLESGAEEPLHQTLSDREYQVMCMIASGKTVKEIAEELSLSAKTISTYRTRILVKMQMKKTAELIRYAIENRLLD
jgi:two-component system invasion response regulator UvrY